jgi:acetyltransferase-like isoleucine patch superfamily enzyme
MDAVVSMRENQSLESATDRRQDPLMWVSRFLIKANSIWLKHTYGFDGFGKGVSIHYSCDIQRRYSHKIRVGDFVLLDREVWLNVPIASERSEPTLIIGNGSNIGRRSVISAINQIWIQENVLFAPGVFVTDHNHEYTDPNLAVHAQGLRRGGRIVIERNCWLGYGSMVLSGKDDLVLGRNSVVGAYAVVTKSHPPFSVLVGNPARVVRQFDAASGQWVKC